jgi:hypothetical protein
VPSKNGKFWNRDKAGADAIKEKVEV